MIKNNPKLAGQNAGRAVFFDFCQLKLFPVHTRHDAVEWFVTDAMTPDPETGNPAVVIQAESRIKALQAIVDLLNIRKNSGVKRQNYAVCPECGEIFPKNAAESQVYCGSNCGGPEDKFEYAEG